MKPISLDSMRRGWHALPTLAVLLVVALLFSVQDMHAPASNHGPDSQGHGEMASSAHDPGAHEVGEGAVDCSVSSSCSLYLVIVSNEYPASTVATTPRRNVDQRAVPANAVERPYRPPILPA